MSDGTSIEWTDASWNPLRARAKIVGGGTGWACVRVSQGCVNCYAATFNKRLGTGLDYTVPALAKVETYLDEKVLDAPLHWRKPRKVFVCSMTDLFGEWVSDSEIAEVFGVMARARQHTFQVLTKRPERMRHWVADVVHFTEGLPNVWLGTSVEDQASADERIPHLLATPAAVRFLSCEPLLGPVDLGVAWSASRRSVQDLFLNGFGIDWLIVGGESGARARPMDLAWARSLVAQCRAARVAPFVKQIGSKPVVGGSDMKQHRFYSTESHGRAMDEWPEDLRIREWPSNVVEKQEAHA
jgi:protein gp37